MGMVLLLLCKLKVSTHCAGHQHLILKGRGRRLTAEGKSSDGRNHNPFPQFLPSTVYKATSKHKFLLAQ
jgi:hypothetical protein